jgi:MarR family transcriptional regulator for hemolysin
VVGALVLQSGLTQKEIADKMGIEGATLVPVIDKMEKDGLLKRKTDLADRRANRIYLTPKADSLWESMTECALKIRKSSTKNISENDIQITLDTLHKISKNLASSFELEKTPSSVKGNKRSA